MDKKQELLSRLQPVICEHLGVHPDEITEDSTWTELGADSLDRLQMSLAVEQAFKVEIPHQVGERLNTVGETAEHLLNLLAARKPIFNIRAEEATTYRQWAKISEIRDQVFSTENGFAFQPLPAPGEPGVWHFVARDENEAIGTLSIVDTTNDSQLHHRYRLNFDKNDRVARYAQLAILKPYRNRGIFKMLFQMAQSTVIRSQGFNAEWLLYPVEHAQSSVLAQSLGFTVEAPLLKTEFGRCRVLIRRKPAPLQLQRVEESAPTVETCPI